MNLRVQMSPPGTIVSFSRRFGKNVMFPSSGRPNQFQVDVEVLGRKSVDYNGGRK